MKPALILLLIAGLTATSAHAECRRGGVEWIVGGPAPFDCGTQVAAAPASRDVGARPKVGVAQQRARDDERFNILAQELAQEERLLPRAADADSARRIRENIAALKREMARLGTPAR
jgi:hypothetical protein